MARSKRTKRSRPDEYFFWGKLLMAAALLITLVNLFALQQEIAPQEITILGNKVIATTYVEELVAGGKIVLTLLNLALLAFIAATSLLVMGLRELLLQQPPASPPSSKRR